MPDNELSVEESKKEEVKPKKAVIKAKSPLISVKVLKSRSGSALVEWVRDGIISRNFVPLDALENGAVGPSGQAQRVVSLETLQASPLYGIPWELLWKPTVAPEDVANRLRAAGIFTADDLAKNMQRGVSVLQGAYRLDVGQLLKIALKFEEEEV